MHGQSVLISFATDVQFHQMLGELFPSALRFWAVGQNAVYAQRAINGKYVHWHNSRDHFSSE